ARPMIRAPSSTRPPGSRALPASVMAAPAPGGRAFYPDCRYTRSAIDGRKARGPRRSPQPPSSRAWTDSGRLEDRRVHLELGQARRGRLAGVGVPARHLVIETTRGEELLGVDPLALERSVADSLVHPLGQDVVGGREPFPAVEEARERVRPLTHLHELV